MVSLGITLETIVYFCQEKRTVEIVPSSVMVSKKGNVIYNENCCVLPILSTRFVQSVPITGANTDNQRHDTEDWMKMVKYGKLKRKTCGILLFIATTF